MLKGVLVFIGGGVGSVLRYAMSGWVYSVMGSGFPYGTFAVNVLGSFVIGFFMTLAEDRFLISPDVRIFVAIGVIGGFTTFSTFTFETVKLLKAGSFFTGGLNIVTSVTVSLTAVWLGGVTGKLIY